VENIRLDLNNQEQIFEQIKKAERAEEEINQKVQEVKKKVEKQQNENKELRDKLESLRRKNSATPPSHGGNKNETIVRELENQIKQIESKITNLPKQAPKENTKSSYLSPTSLRNSNLMSGKKEFPYVKIIEDIEEIKSILTVNLEIEYFESNSSFRLKEMRKSKPYQIQCIEEVKALDCLLPSVKITNENNFHIFLVGAMTPHKSMFLSHVKSSSQLFISEK